MNEERSGKKIPIPIFEILVIDKKGENIINDKKKFLEILKVFSNVFLQKEGIKIYIKKLNKNESKSFKQGYVIEISGSFEMLEKIRIQILKYIQSLYFEEVYVLRDDISKIISTGLYEWIYKVESALRRYITKFFILKNGSEWWDSVSTNEMQKKAEDRKKNEQSFSKFIENKIYLIDLNDLGQIIQTLSGHNLTIDQLIEKVKELKKDNDSVENIQEEIKGKHKDFFDNNFKKNNFQSNIEELLKIRNKVAHNNLFILEDQDKGRVLAEEVLKTIEDADNSIEYFKEEDFENFKKYSDYKTLTEDIFLEELEFSLKKVKEGRLKFIGLQFLIINIFGNKGYEYEAVRDMVNKLENDDKIKIYQYESQENDYPVAAIKLKEIK